MPQSGEGSGDPSSDAGSTGGFPSTGGTEAGEGEQQGSGSPPGQGEQAGQGPDAGGDGAEAGGDGSQGGAAGQGTGAYGSDADLEAIFDGSLGDFDGEIQGERERIASSGQGTGRGAANREAADASRVEEAGTGGMGGFGDTGGDSMGGGGQAGGVGQAGGMSGGMDGDGASGSSSTGKEGQGAAGTNAGEGFGGSPATRALPSRSIGRSSSVLPSPSISSVSAGNAQFQPASTHGELGMSRPLASANSGLSPMLPVPPSAPDQPATHE